MVVRGCFVVKGGSRTLVLPAPGVKPQHKPAQQRMWHQLRGAKACPVFPCIVSCPADPDQGHSQGFADFHQSPILEPAWAGNTGATDREHMGSLHRGSQGFSLCTSISVHLPSSFRSINLQSNTIMYYMLLNFLISYMHSRANGPFSLWYTHRTPLSLNGVYMGLSSDNKSLNIGFYWHLLGNSCSQHTGNVTGHY